MNFDQHTERWERSYHWVKVTHFENVSLGLLILTIQVAVSEYLLLNLLSAKLKNSQRLIYISR